MHILVFGGTGNCGQAFIPDALHAGHHLTLYARSPSKFPRDVRDHANVSMVQGEFTDVEALKEALSKGAEVLVSFAGPELPSKGMFMTEFYERLYQLVPDYSSIRRCIVLSTASFKVPEDTVTWKWWIVISMISLLGGTCYQEINGLSRATSSLGGNDIQWTLFRVPNLTGGEAKPVQASYLGDGTDGLFVTRKSVAIWVLQELEEKKWVDKAPCLSNPGWI
ncbi:hypothetical protein LTR37_001269 [Vermiconidia calcicola]|uniref:Uncharacterized protein n=1 Tax=Vermiconidia calcicola TaxID=1690605 RepID=A0ACC3NWK2_9PEZI|nr:hypothetical protein LTR37_001269 [Vermiconidia calcicola]